jgi:hypothetical protein
LPQLRCRIPRRLRRHLHTRSKPPQRLLQRRLPRPRPPSRPRRLRRPSPPHLPGRRLPLAPRPRLSTKPPPALPLPVLRLLTAVLPRRMRQRALPSAQPQGRPPRLSRFRSLHHP